VFEAIFLGMIQGFFEFLPVSSSAHLLLASYFFNFSEDVINSNMFDTILHGGSIIAILLFFYKDVIKALKNKRIMKGLFISTLPTFVIGLIIEPFKDVYFRGIWISFISLVIWGFYMIYAEKKSKEIKNIEELNVKDYLILGFMQSIALIPGTSRSGITISTALLLNLKKDDALSVSFLIGLPVIFAAFAYEFRKAVITKAFIDYTTLFVGLSSSLVFSLLALVFLVKFIKKFKFSSFAYYRFGLAAFIVGYNLWKSL
jgi:undecaprenyl-diphosphatase